MKKVTLSFDNGPTPNVTPFVLKTLDERALHAYFCVVGKQLQCDEANPQLCREALGLGHVLVNHSLTHETPLGEQPTAAHAHAEIRDMHDLMQDLIGDWGEPWFRPFGREGALGTHVFSQAALDELSDLRYSVLMWNSVPRDWIDIDGWVARALEDISAQRHTLLVLHDIDSGAMKLLPAFLDQLLDHDITITLELPDTCVPMRKGVANSECLTGLVNAA